MENLRDVIYELDSQGVVLYISPAIRDMLGYDSSDIVGKNFIEFAHKDDQSSLAEWFSELRKGKEIPSEYRVSNKSGDLRWARTQTRPIMEDGLFKGARGILLDVTAQRRVEEALRESEKKYRLVVDNMADVITVMDLNLRFTYVSPSVIRLRGYTAEEVMAQTLEQIMTPESLQIVARVVEEEMKMEASGTADPGRTRILELEEYKKDGSTVWLENRLSSFRDKEKKLVGIIALSYDITERKQAERALEESEAKTAQHPGQHRNRRGPHQSQDGGSRTEPAGCASGSLPSIRVNTPSVTARSTTRRAKRCATTARPTRHCRTAWSTKPRRKRRRQGRTQLPHRFVSDPQRVGRGYGGDRDGRGHHRETFPGVPVPPGPRRWKR